jgi:ribosomal protein S6--L-glutamate ligase
MTGRIAVVCANEKTYSIIRLMSELRRAGENFFLLKYPDTSLYIDTKRTKIFRGSTEISLSSIKGTISRIGSGEIPYIQTLLYQLQAEGIRVINSPQMIYNCNNKFETLQLLYKKNIAIPRTFYPYSKNTESFEAIEKMLGHRKQILVKLLKGSGGAGISKIAPRAVADVIETVWETKEDVHLQEFIKFATAKGGRGRDVRVIVIGGEVAGGYQRVGRKGAFKANIHAGGQPHHYSLTIEQKKIAVKCAEAVNADYCGVDILSSPDKKENIVIEVNSSPGFEGFEQGTGVNIAKKVVTFCVSQFKGGK